MDVRHGITGTWTGCSIGSFCFQTQLQASPALSFLDHGLQTYPRVERNADRVLRAVPMKQANHIVPEERPVESELEDGGAQGVFDLSEQIAEEAQRGLAIVDVALVVLDPQKVPSLRQVGGDRIVAGDLAPVRIEAPEGSTFSPVDTTVPSTSIVKRRSPSESITSAINSALNASNAVRTARVQRDSQRLIVRAVGRSLSPQIRLTRGSLAR